MNQSIKVELETIQPATVVRVALAEHGASLASQRILLNDCGEYRLSLQTVAEQIQDALGLTHTEWEDAELSVAGAFDTARQEITFQVTRRGWD